MSIIKFTEELSERQDFKINKMKDFSNLTLKELTDTEVL